jgi:hypothetical protein
MAETPYFGRYYTFETVDKKAAADLLGANNLVGDRYTIEFEDTDEGTRAWLVNRFEDRVGYLDDSAIHQVRLAQARGWTTAAYLSFVAYSEQPEPGHYWGQVALIAYDPKYDDEMQVFLKAVVEAMAGGARPKIDLGSTAFKQLIDSKGTWFPKDRQKMPSHDKQTAIIKDHRSANDRLVEASRKGNAGCYIASWAFLLAVVAGIAFGLHSCGMF